MIFYPDNKVKVVKSGVLKKYVDERMGNFDILHVKLVKVKFKYRDVKAHFRKKEPSRMQSLISSLNVGSSFRLTRARTLKLDKNLLLHTGEKYNYFLSIVYKNSQLKNTQEEIDLNKCSGQVFLDESHFKLLLIKENTGITRGGGNNKNNKNNKVEDFILAGANPKLNQEWCEAFVSNCNGINYVANIAEYGYKTDDLLWEPVNIDQVNSYVRLFSVYGRALHTIGNVTNGILSKVKLSFDSINLHVKQVKDDEYLYMQNKKTFYLNSAYDNSKIELTEPLDKIMQKYGWKAKDELSIDIFRIKYMGYDSRAIYIFYAENDGTEQLYAFQTNHSKHLYDLLNESFVDIYNELIRVSDLSD